MEMSLQDKKRRLNELKANRFLSNEEFEEMERLEQEVQTQDNATEDLGPVEPVQPVKEKRSIVQFIADKIKKKEEQPITIEELQQMKLQVVKERMEADIAESRYIKKKIRKQEAKDTLNALFGPLESSSGREDEAKEAYRRKVLGY
jgi:hypothetical protein